MCFAHGCAEAAAVVEQQLVEIGASDVITMIDAQSYLAEAETGRATQTANAAAMSRAVGIGWANCALGSSAGVIQRQARQASSARGSKVEVQKREIGQQAEGVVA